MSLGSTELTWPWLQRLLSCLCSRACVTLGLRPALQVQGLCYRYPLPTAAPGMQASSSVQVPMLSLLPPESREDSSVWGALAMHGDVSSSPSIHVKSWAQCCLVEIPRMMRREQEGPWDLLASSLTLERTLPQTTQPHTNYIHTHKPHTCKP